MGTDTGRRHGLRRLVGVTGVSAALIATGITALAGGNPNYLGILHGANPTGYQVSPNAYDISGGPVTVTIQQSVTNLTTVAQTVSLNMRVHHILTLNGVDISDGQPGQTGIAWTRALVHETTQALVGQTPTQTITVPVGLTPTVMTWSWTFNSCGYFQFDIAKSRCRPNDPAEAWLSRIALKVAAPYLRRERLHALGERCASLGTSRAQLRSTTERGHPACSLHSAACRRTMQRSSSFALVMVMPTVRSQAFGGGRNRGGVASRIREGSAARRAQRRGARPGIRAV